MMVTASKSSPHSVIMVMNMTTKRSLPILFLTLALVAGSVALAHAPPSQAPVIGTPVINPTSPAFGDAVTVSVNVTSARSTIKNVTITYTTDNWMSTNTTIVATYNATTTTATGRIPAFAAGAHVEYYIIAFAYTVSAPTSLTSISTLTYILVAAGIAAGIAAVAFMILKAPQRRSKQSKSSSTQDQNWTRGSP